jgi:hypothetical protein
MLGERLGLEVEVVGDRHIRARGAVRGHPTIVEIEGGGGKREFFRFLFGNNTIGSRNRRDHWHTVLAVGCTNPSGSTGTITSAVDVNDPAWTPGAYDPRNGRKVTTDPPSLAELALTPDIRERLMGVVPDLSIEVQPTFVRLDVQDTAMPGGASYVAGSPIHQYQGSPPPWPERALVGPPWWIDLLASIADALDR